MKKFVLSIILFPCINLFSQDNIVNDTLYNLSEVLIKGNRIEIPFNETTRDIQIINSNEISNLPVKSINELLSYTGGIDIRQRGPFGGQADISIDGGTFEQTLVLLNGIKLQDDQTAHIMMNLPLPIEAIERIEVIRGAAARIYGANALTGAVNIVTKKESTPFVMVSTYAGSSFKSKEEGDGKGTYNGGGIALTGNYGDSKQNHLLSVAQDSYNGQRYNTALNNTRFFYNGNYQFNTKHSIQALGSYIDNKFGANGFYAAPGDKDSEEIDKTSLFSISSKHRFGNLTLMPRVSNRYNKDDYRYFKHDLNTARSVHYTNAFMAEMNLNLSTFIGEFGIGWESRISNINSTNIGKHNRNNHGAYIEYKGKYWGRLITNIGVYLNYNSDYGWQAYPGLDLAYLLNDTWKISASIGSAQRLPSFTDLHLDQAPGNIGNPLLESEKAWQYEGALSYAIPHFQSKIGYFYRNISNFIDWVRENPERPYIPYNLGENKMKGIYARIKQDFTFKNSHKLGYQLSYHYLHPKMETVEEKDQSKYILENLKHQFILSLNYTYQNFGIQVQNRYHKRELNSSYTLVDLRTSYQINNLRIYADITNALNQSYREAGAVPMPPRWFSVGLVHHWR